MEDAEDDSQINDDEWEDMELEDNMENMVDMDSFFAYKKGTKLMQFHRLSLLEVEVQLFQR